MTDRGTYRRNYFGFKPLVSPEPHICVLTTNYALAELAKDIWLSEVGDRWEWRLDIKTLGRHNTVGVHDETDNTWAIIDWKKLQVVGWTHTSNQEWFGPWLGGVE